MARASTSPPREGDEDFTPTTVGGLGLDLFEAEGAQVDANALLRLPAAGTSTEEPDEEYWWTFAGQQDAISAHMGVELDLGETWDVKRKGALKRGMRKYKKRTQGAAVMPGGLSNESDTVSRKGRGIWKG